MRFPIGSHIKAVSNENGQEYHKTWRILDGDRCETLSEDGRVLITSYLTAGFFEDNDLWSFYLVDKDDYRSVVL